MNTLTNSLFIEDSHIAYLAGQKEAKNIGLLDNISQTQKQTITTTKGIGLLTLGLLSYPLINNTMRQSILGSDWDVGIACVWKNGDISMRLAEFIDRKILKYLASNLSDGFGCRIINYVGSLRETLVNNSILIGAMAVGLFVLCGTLQNEAKAEAEEGLKRILSDRFGKTAARLTALEGDPEVQECASKILQRQREINQEIENLKLSSLKYKDIQQITQPVFDAARNVINKKQGSDRIQEFKSVLNNGYDLFKKSMTEVVQKHDNDLTEKSAPKVVLKRDADGLYTLPHVNVPGFVNMGTFRGRELNIHAGNFVVDTANGILPPGWVLER